MNAKSMEKRQRVILYGRTIILGTIAASLQKQSQFELIPLSAPYPSAQELGEMEPDVILFDLDSARPEAAFSLLADCPGLLLIGIDPDRDQIQIWSGQHLPELSVQDLVDVIQNERHGDEENRRRGDFSVSPSVSHHRVTESSPNRRKP